MEFPRHGIGELYQHSTLCLNIYNSLESFYLDYSSSVNTDVTFNKNGIAMLILKTYMLSVFSKLPQSYLRSSFYVHFL